MHSFMLVSMMLPLSSTVATIMLYCDVIWHKAYSITGHAISTLIEKSIKLSNNSFCVSVPVSGDTKSECME